MPLAGVQTCARSEEHTSELQSHSHLVCRLLLEKKKQCNSTAKCSGTTTACSTRLARRPGISASPSRKRARTYASSNKSLCWVFFFFFNDTATPEIYPLPLHDALPI